MIRPKFACFFTLFLTLTLFGNGYCQQAYVPDLSLSLGEFEEKALREKDEVWVVDFWASWCGPCIRAVPEMKDLHSRYADRGVRFISISWDRSEARWRSALDRLQMPWHHIIVPRGEEGFLEEEFPHKGIPTAFVIGRDGKVKKVSNVYKLGKAIEKQL